MTTSQQTRSEALPLEEKTVADYLRNNPEFFQNNPSLLASLEIPHSCGPAISLVEHQIKVLRDQNAQLKRKLMDLVHVARDRKGSLRGQDRPPGVPPECGSRRIRGRSSVAVPANRRRGGVGDACRLHHDDDTTQVGSG